MPMQTDRQSKVVFRIPSTSTHLSALLAVRNASIVRPFLFLVLIFVYILYLSSESLFLFRYRNTTSLFFIRCPLYHPTRAPCPFAMMPRCLCPIFSSPFAILTTFTTHLRFSITLHHLLILPIHIKINTFVVFHNQNTPTHTRNNVHTHPPTLVLDFSLSQALIAGPRHPGSFTPPSSPRLLILAKYADLIQSTQIVQRDVHPTIPYIPHSSQKNRPVSQSCIPCWIYTYPILFERSNSLRLPIWGSALEHFTCLHPLVVAVVAQNRGMKSKVKRYYRSKCGPKAIDKRLRRILKYVAS